MATLMLEQLMDEVEDEAMYSASRGEMRHQLLAIQRRDGGKRYERLVVPGVHPSTVAKILIARIKDAVYAALAFESWMVGGRDDDPLVRLVANHVITPSEAPPELRQDVLWILGESKDGERATRRYVITPPDEPGGLRGYRPHEADWERAVEEINVFRPLFAPRDEVARLLHRVIMGP